MKRCSYTWEQWDKEVGRVGLQCPEEIWPGSEEFCIFHDPSPKKDIELLEGKLKRKLRKKDYSFIGYYFPETADFTNTRFTGNSNFSEAIFQDVIFRGATFQENADFSKVTFKEDADFTDATFKKKVDFSMTTFNNADFVEAKFQNADFYGAIFQEVYFTRAVFQKKAYFFVAKFQNADFIGTKFQNADFSGTKFQEVNFSEATFKRNVDFFRATFQEDANFSGTKFQEVNFSEATFKRNVDFFRATFQEDADFRGAIFQNADFSEAMLKNVDFRKVVIKENLEFVPLHVKEINFQNIKFFFKGIISADLRKAKFHRAYLENIVFVDCIWPQNIHEETYIEDERLSFKELETIYRDLKQNMQRHGDYSRAGEFYYREMEMRRKGTEAKKRRLWLELYRLVAGYGEKPERTAFSSIVTVSTFAILYLVLECLKYPMRNPTVLQKVESVIYFSFVTFTTLGLGDIEPVNVWGRALICCEAVIGAFLIALFVVVFARKMMR